jgi:multidrug transporter EmrE-like cation transporter
MKRFIELFGWYGTIAIVAAYALVSFSVLQPTDIVYQLLNGTGALGIVLVSFHKQAYQPGVLNIIWTLIAVAAILKILF